MFTQINGSIREKRKNIKEICPALPGYLQHVGKVPGNVVCPTVSPACQHHLKVLENIPFKGTDGFSGHDEILSIIPFHSPHHKGQRHADRLPGPDRPICNDTSCILYRASVCPPGKNLSLFLAVRTKAPRIWCRELRPQGLFLMRWR